MSHGTEGGESVAQAAVCKALIGYGYSSQHAAVEAFISHLIAPNVTSMGWASSGEYWTLLVA